MKLISLYVSSFGNLKDFSFEFKDGINTVKQDNGWGKSTLAAFIKAVFYGLNDTKKSIEENDRIKYRPWNSIEKFGGSIKFNKSGKEFILERFFGTKSSEDTVKLTDAFSGKEFPNTENLGRRLFEIDEDGFLSTLFLSQKDFVIKSNDSLTAKFNSEESGDAEQAFNKALTKVEDKQKTYKGRGDKGIIPEIKSKIFSIDGAIAQSTRASETVSALKERLEERNEKFVPLKAECDALTRKIEAYGKTEAVKIKRENLENLEKERESVLDNRNKCLEVLNGNYIEEQDVFDLGKSIKDYYALKNSPKTQPQNTVKKGIGALGVLSLVSALVAVFGVISIFFLGAVIGIVIAVLGALGTAFPLLIGKKHRTEKLKDSQDGFVFELEDGLKRYFARFNVGEGNFDLLYERLKTAFYSNRNYTEMLAKIDEKIAKYSCDKESDSGADNLDIVALRRELQQKTQSLNELSGETERLKTQIAYNEESSSNLLNLLDEKNELLEKLSNASAEYDILSLTAEYLKKADENLKIKYRTPLQNSLDKYLALLTGGKIKATVDIDLKLSCIEKGLSVDSDYYSKGVKNLLAVCERFALIDVMYPKEKPFIVLDDPFSDLDEENLGASVKTVKDLSKEYQIIYLTCHESRVI